VGRIADLNFRPAFVFYYFAGNGEHFPVHVFCQCLGAAPEQKTGLRQKTCWLFKQKVMRAMKSSGNFPMDGKVDVDETYVGGQDDQAI